MPNCVVKNKHFNTKSYVLDREFVFEKLDKSSTTCQNILPESDTIATPDVIKDKSLPLETIASKSFIDSFECKNNISYRDKDQEKSEIFHETDNTKKEYIIDAQKFPELAEILKFDETFLDDWNNQSDIYLGRDQKKIQEYLEEENVHTKETIIEHVDRSLPVCIINNEASTSINVEDDSLPHSVDYKKHFTTLAQIDRASSINLRSKSNLNENVDSANYLSNLPENPEHYNEKTLKD
ncbi:hypothetical protein CDIK_3780, partial [Cucumispora dikerogammari]